MTPKFKFKFGDRVFVNGEFGIYWFEIEGRELHKVIFDGSGVNAKTEAFSIGAIRDASKVNSFEISGRKAVKLGYDGGGIWEISGMHGKAYKTWRSKDNAVGLEGVSWSWPDMSYPETEGAMLDWIKERLRCRIVSINHSWKGYFITGLHCNGTTYFLSDTLPSKIDAVLGAVKFASNSSLPGDLNDNGIEAVVFKNLSITR